MTMLFPRRSRFRYSGAVILIYCLLAVAVLVSVGKGRQNVSSIDLMRMHELAIHSAMLRSEAEMLLDAAARPESEIEWQRYSARMAIRIVSIKNSIRLIDDEFTTRWAVIFDELENLQAALKSLGSSISANRPRELGRFRSAVYDVTLDLRDLSENTISSQNLTLKGFASSVFVLSAILATLGFLGILLLLHRRHRILQLLRLSNEDELTGLASRRYAQRKGMQRSEQARAQNSVLTLAVLDIDHFKLVNDTFGHAAGDEVICCVANALRQLGIKSGTAARFGGEEFLVIMPKIELGEAVSLFSQLQKDLRDGWSILGVPPTTVSIGIASAKGEAADFTKLYQHADTALYSAKRSGRNRVATHDKTSALVYPAPSTPLAQVTQVSLTDGENTEAIRLSSGAETTDSACNNASLQTLQKFG